jgi:hypothetical protein
MATSFHDDQRKAEDRFQGRSTILNERIFERNLFPSTLPKQSEVRALIEIATAIHERGSAVGHLEAIRSLQGHLFARDARSILQIVGFSDDVIDRTVKLTDPSSTRRERREDISRDVVFCAKSAARKVSIMAFEPLSLLLGREKLHMSNYSEKGYRVFRFRTCESFEIKVHGKWWWRREEQVPVWRDVGLIRGSDVPRSLIEVFSSRPEFLEVVRPLIDEVINSESLRARKPILVSFRKFPVTPA